MSAINFSTNNSIMNPETPTSHKLTQQEILNEKEKDKSFSFWANTQTRSDNVTRYNVVLNNITNGCEDQAGSCAKSTLDIFISNTVQNHLFSVDKNGDDGVALYMDGIILQLESYGGDSNNSIEASRYYIDTKNGINSRIDVNIHNNRSVDCNTYSVDLKTSTVSHRVFGT